MKKQFFYAAMAVALMASCTSEDNLSVDPIIPDDDDKVAIQLGVDAPTVNATVGRAVGSVGDTEGASNVWNGERLFITMVDKETDSVAVQNGQAVLNHSDYAYYAPRGGVNATDSGSVRIYKNVTANLPETDGNGKGTLSYVYYPVSGQYDFYGWHLDDANKGVTAPTIKIEKGIKTVTGIKINGQQDIMGARTREFTEENYFWQGSGVTANYADMVGWDFSARTARNKIHPVLKFEHQLARLKFFVKAGSDKTAQYKYVGSDWVKNESTESPARPTAMQVKSIKVVNVINTIDMNLDGRDAKTGKPAVTASAVTAEVDTFTLGSRVSGVMTDLVATAPLVYDGTGTATDNSEVIPADGQTPAKKYADYKAGTQVGESVMFFPGTNSSKTVELEVQLAQLVQTLDGETDDTKDYWEEKTQTAKLFVHASSVKNQTNSAVTAFEPGKSYNVYITVYGFERIEITAELTAWENGGNANVDVEEGQSRHNVDVDFVLKNAEGAVVTPTSITATYSYKNNAGETVTNQNAVFNGTKTTVPSFAVLNYTIKADGYKDATGIVNARNGQTVNIIMEADGTATEPEEQPFEVTFNYTLLDMTSVVVADDAITITSPANCTVSNGKVIVPAGTTEIIYSIAETELYQAISESHATVSAEYPSVHVTMTPKAQAPTKKSFTIDVTNKSDFSVDFSLVVKEAGEEGATVEPTEKNGNVFKLEVEKSYVISISGKAAEGSEPKTATKEIEVTAEMEDENTITIAFPTEEGGGI